MQQKLYTNYRSLLRHIAQTVVVIVLIAVCIGCPLPVFSQTAGQINVPYHAGAANPSQGAIFWFGQVDKTSNYADVRIAYDEEKLLVVLHIFDRQLWYDRNASPTSDLTEWDAATVYLDLSDNPASTLSEQSYRFVVQVNHWEPRDNYQQTYRGSDSAWMRISLPMTTTTSWRGGGFNNKSNEDRGWVAQFPIPFTSLGLTGPPPTGTVWQLGLALHDRDDSQDTAILEQFWPENLNSESPSSWGKIHFGLPRYTPPPTTSTSLLTLRNGVDDINVVDAHVGGHSECGADYNPNFFDGWGDANYAGYYQINIQNQWDVADWPCFSKYYINFPIDSLPENSAVLSATLTMQMFGSAGSPSVTKPSHIQVATVGEDWDEASLTWNNAPQVHQNFTSTMVEPIYFYAPHARPAPITWDVSWAIAQAVAVGEPLRLVLYSTDGDYHSGKYFWSADVRSVGPELNVTFGALAELPPPDDEPDDNQNENPDDDSKPESPRTSVLFLPIIKH